MLVPEATERRLASPEGFLPQGWKRASVRLWRSIMWLLAGWSFGRNGWQRKVRTTFVTSLDTSAHLRSNHQKTAPCYHRQV